MHENRLLLTMYILTVIQCYLGVQVIHHNRLLPGQNLYTHPSTMLSGSMAVRLFTTIGCYRQ
ncbi:hypothetical protein NA56DRAFT_156116 [Hyaloscypha hepaticicola]|uniref:Uncharacterized protein n=1 Tax=Hyaloscypha hepaticicola TaxID=2082293 RepID=A0A2J6Q3F0_9HELO|nr:hypothetical protein NA56DRAFT_156116 [Hyaloscypha hepaticicola]